MTKSIDQTFFELFNIFTDGASYIPEKNNSDIKSSESIQRKLIQLLSGKNSVYDLDESTISGIACIFKEIFSSINMIVDFSSFGSYLRNYLTLKHTPCTYFVDSSDIAHNFNDNDAIPIDILFKGMSCKSCGLFKESHSVCSKYISLDISSDISSNIDFMFSDCHTCGLSKYDHKVCDKFCIDSDESIECITCGRDIKTHQTHEIKKRNYPCKNFVEIKNNCINCTNCIHSRTYHMFNPRLFKMNSKSFDEFNMLAFEYNAQYIGLSDQEKQEKKSQFYKVLCMNYGSNHPMYQTFSNSYE
jgi:hypothetical protein